MCLNLLNLYIIFQKEVKILAKKPVFVAFIYITVKLKIKTQIKEYWLDDHFVGSDRNGTSC